MQDTCMNRRAVLASAGALGVALCGCISTSPTPPGSMGAGGDESSDDGGESPRKTVELGGSSTVYPITNTAGKYWNANAPSTNKKLWGPSQYGIETQENMADYWAGLYGFSPTDGGSPPFSSRVLLSHSGTGLEKLRKGRLDIGNSSAPVKAEFPELEKSVLDKYTDHVVGVDAQPIVVSQEIHEAGVTRMDGKTLKAIYRGEIDNWTQVEGYEGPKRTIQVVGRPSGSGTSTAFRLNLFGDPKANLSGVDLRKGQNQQVKSTVKKSDNAIAYMALAFVDESVPAISLKFNSKLYVPGKNLAEKGYPLARDLHCYTWEGTSRIEAAFLRMIISDFGQQSFVKGVGYATLTNKRQKKQLKRLPEVKQ
jgi:phosphate transport system substrate-binding protein